MSNKNNKNKNFNKKSKTLNSGEVMFTNGLQSLAILKKMKKGLANINTHASICLLDDNSKSFYNNFNNIVNMAVVENETLLTFADIRLSILSWLSLITSTRYIADDLSTVWLEMSNKQRYSALLSNIKKSFSRILRSNNHKLDLLVSIFARLAKAFNDIRYLNDRRDLVKNADIVVTYDDDNHSMYVDRANSIVKVNINKDGFDQWTYTQLIPSSKGKSPADIGIYFTFDSEGRFAIKSHELSEELLATLNGDDVPKNLLHTALLNDLLMYGRDNYELFLVSADAIKSFINDCEDMIEKDSLASQVEEESNEIKGEPETQLKPVDVDDGTESRVESEGESNTQKESDDPKNKELLNKIA